MAVTGKLFGKVFLSLFNKEIDWDSDDIRVMLTTSAYTPDQDVHDYKDDVTNEVTGTGYTANGVALASKTITYTAGTNTIMLDAADSTWSASTITARNAVIYDNTPGTAATKPLIGYQASDADVSSSSGDFTIQWHANGIVSIVVS